MTDAQTTGPVVAVTMGRDLPDDPDTYRLHTAYVGAVIAAGATPIALFPGTSSTQLTRLMASVDGVLLPGGVDPHPRAWDEFVDPRSTIDEPLDALEYAVLEAAESDRLPVLGICRGCQVINVAAGGSLVQHLDDGPVDHYQEARLDESVHPVTLAEGSVLRSIYGASNIDVNSFHHQAVGQVAPSLRVAATAQDGVVEALELSSGARWVVGVQFHPERFGTDGHARLFREFVAACAERALQRTRSS